jgi:FtsP/CotA-like multicopper oxidase with cupredoxin domain
VFTDFAADLGEAFAESRSLERRLYGYAEHEVRTTYLGSSSGLRLRHDQPAGTVQINAKDPHTGSSTWVGQHTRDFGDVDTAALAREVHRRSDWAQRRVELPAGRSVSGREIPQDVEVAQEVPMVLNDAGTIGLSLNGKSFPATEPIVAQEGDWLVIHYYNEGLQEHPMHLHGFPQLVYAKDGFPLESPRWEDTVNVAPGERYSVLVHADMAGVWAFHCHILTHAERAEGMFGMVTALIVE